MSDENALKRQSTIGVKFKIFSPNDEKHKRIIGEQKEKLDDLFNEYAKAVTFCLIRLPKLGVSFTGKKVNGKWIGENGTCGECKANGEMMHFSKLLNAPICKSCSKRVFGKQMVRKLFVATKARQVEGWLDIRKSAKLDNTLYHRIPEEAYTMIQTAEKLRDKKKKRMTEDRKKLNMLSEILEKPECRKPIAKKEGERVDRYAHIKSIQPWGYTLNQLPRKIAGIERAIRKTEQRILQKGDYKFRGHRVKLDKKWIKFDFEKSAITIPHLFKETEFGITTSKNVKSKTGSKYFEEWAKRISEQPDNYCYLISKEPEDEKSEKEYYLQYTISKEVDLSGPYCGALVDCPANKFINY